MSGPRLDPNSLEVRAVNCDHDDEQEDGICRGCGTVAASVIEGWDRAVDEMWPRHASPEPTPGLREAAERIGVLHHDSLHSRAVSFWDCDWSACTMLRAALAASPAPEPTPGLRERIEALPRLRLSGKRLDDLAVSFGNVTQADEFFVDIDEVADFVELDAVRAALAASPAPEPTGLDAAWATDLTNDEIVRLADALAKADHKNWGSLDLATMIAGTVRAIAAARLTDSGATDGE